MPISNQFELRHLRYFQEVARELNFRKAAEKLFITQPGLSRQIHQLEESIDAQLFVRDKRNVQLTAAGKYLQQETALIFNQLDKVIKNTAHIHHGDSGEVSIGFVGSAMQLVIPTLLKQLNKSHPGIHTILTELSNQQQLDAILSDALDIGFIRYMKTPRSIEVLEMHEDTFSLVIPVNHHLNLDNFTNISQLQAENFILFSPDYSPGYYEKIMSIFDDHGFSPRVSHETVHANTIFRLVEQGLGVGIVPTSLTQGFDLKIRFIELHGIRQRTKLSAVWKKNHHNPLLEKLIEQLHGQKANIKFANKNLL